MLIGLYDHHAGLPHNRAPGNPWRIFHPIEMAGWTYRHRSDMPAVAFVMTTVWPVLQGLAQIKTPLLMAHVSVGRKESEPNTLVGPKRTLVEITSLPQVTGEGNLPVVVQKEGEQAKPTVTCLWRMDSTRFYSPYNLLSDESGYPHSPAPLAEQTSFWADFFVQQLRAAREALISEVASCGVRLSKLVAELHLLTDVH